MRSGRKPSLRCVNKIESSAREIGSQYIIVTTSIVPSPLSKSKQHHGEGQPENFPCCSAVAEKSGAGVTAIQLRDPRVHPVQGTNVSTLSPPTRCTPSILLAGPSSLHLARSRNILEFISSMSSFYFAKTTANLAITTATFAQFAFLSKSTCVTRCDESRINSDEGMTYRM